MVGLLPARFFEPWSEEHLIFEVIQAQHLVFENDSLSAEFQTLISVPDPQDPQKIKTDWQRPLARHIHIHD